MFSSKNIPIYEDLIESMAEHVDASELLKSVLSSYISSNTKAPSFSSENAKFSQIKSSTHYGGGKVNIRIQSDSAVSLQCPPHY